MFEMTDLFCDFPLEAAGFRGACETTETSSEGDALLGFATLPTSAAFLTGVCAACTSGARESKPFPGTATAGAGVVPPPVLGLLRGDHTCPGGAGLAEYDPFA